MTLALEPGPVEVSMAGLRAPQSGSSGDSKVVAKIVVDALKDIVGSSAASKIVRIRPPRSLGERIELQLDELYTLCSSNQEQRAAEKLLASLEQLLRKGIFHEADEFLTRMVVERLTPTAVIAALSITYYGKDRLRHRAALLERAEAFLRQRIGVQRTNSLLASRR